MWLVFIKLNFFFFGFFFLFFFFLLANKVKLLISFIHYILLVSIEKMLSPLYVATCYIIIFISIPFLINTTNVGALIPTLANHLKIDYYFYQIEPIVLCLGLVTFYAYVFLGFLKDVIQHQQQSHSPYIKLEHGSRQLQELFPCKYNIYTYLSFLTYYI